jgi:hypothetical protein
VAAGPEPEPFNPEGGPAMSAIRLLEESKNLIEKSRKLCESVKESASIVKQAVAHAKEINDSLKKNSKPR